MVDLAPEVEELRAEVAYWVSVAAHSDDVVARLQKELKELRSECDRRRVAREEERRQLLFKLQTERSRRCEQLLSLAMLLVACVLLIAVVASSSLQDERPGISHGVCSPCPDSLSSEVATAGRTTSSPMADDLSDSQDLVPASHQEPAPDYLGDAFKTASLHGDRFARLQRERARQVSSDGAQGGDLSDVSHQYANQLLSVGVERQVHPLLATELDGDGDAEDTGRDYGMAAAGTGYWPTQTREAVSATQKETPMKHETTAATDMRREEQAEQAALSSAMLARTCASMPCMNGGTCVAPRAQATDDGAVDGWKFVEGQGSCPAGLRLPGPSDIPDVAGAVKLLCEWCIAAIGDGHRLSGSGYGGKIEVETGDPPGDILCMPIPAPKVDLEATGSALPTYACECAHGWGGINCDEDVDECAVLKPCHAGASCFDSTTRNAASGTVLGMMTVAVGEYRCDCPLGRRGKHCDEVAPECGTGSRKDDDSIHTYLRHTVTVTPSRHVDSGGKDDSPVCANGGVCYTADDARWSSAAASALRALGEAETAQVPESSDTGDILSRTAVSISRVLCACAAGWVGPRCEDDLDECASSPCLSGGTCIQGHGASKQSATNTGSGFVGHSASGTFGHGKFRCLCPRGRGGSRCEIESATEYASNPAIWRAEAAPSTCNQQNKNDKDALAHSLGAAGFFEGRVGSSAHGSSWVALPPLGLRRSGDHVPQPHDPLGVVTLAFWLRPFSLTHQPSDLGVAAQFSGLPPKQMILSSGGGRSGDSVTGEPQLYLEDGALIFAVESQPESKRVNLSHRFAWTLPPNEWSHVTVSYGAAASLLAGHSYVGAAAASAPQKGFLDLYVNFHFVESAALPGGPPLDLRRLRIGGSVSAAELVTPGISSGLHGMLASIQIFDRPIRAHREVCDGKTPGLLGWWAFAGTRCLPCVAVLCFASQHTELTLACQQLTMAGP